MPASEFFKRLYKLRFKGPTSTRILYFLRWRHKLEIGNYTDKIIEVHIEINPNRYLLKPRDKMVIRAKLKDEPYTVNYCEGSVQVYAGWDIDPEVTINGLPVASDWETPNPG